ncbi:MAG TPA: hypothetical protein VNM67_05705 [Thermoanaerobaculia bacterium]|jgi:hypothetical protein|nr:hypothetical protein [Thermoanaerobaculia bacterium]
MIGIPELDLHLEIRVDLEGEEDAEAVDQLTRQLLYELEESDFLSAHLDRAAAPQGSKSAEAVTLGSLFVGLLPSTFPKFLSFLQSWLKRGEGRTIKIKAASGKASFEVECPADALRADELEKLLAKLSAPFSGAQQARLPKTSK